MAKGEGLLIALAGPKKGGEGGDVGTMKLEAAGRLRKAIKSDNDESIVKEFTLLYDLCAESHAPPDEGDEDEGY